jgi:hypothetical protein
VSPTFRLQVTSQALRHPGPGRKVERMTTHALLVAAMVMIRTYNYMPVPTDDIARARATADRTFHQAGISLQWEDCWVPTSSIVSLLPAEARSAKPGQSSCTDPLREGSDFVLRLVPSASADVTSHFSSRIVAMGSSLIDRDTHAGALATVDAELVLKIARGSRVDFAMLLGRAIAHEIGHLLLGHSRHSRDGLMRALWSQDEMRGIRPANWQFSAAEAAEMRHGLAARARSAN